MLYVPSIELCVYWHSRTQPLPASSRHGAADVCSIGRSSQITQARAAVCCRDGRDVGGWLANGLAVGDETRLGKGALCVRSMPPGLGGNSRGQLELQRSIIGGGGLGPWQAWPPRRERNCIFLLEGEGPITSPLPLVFSREVAIEPLDSSWRREPLLQLLLRRGRFWRPSTLHSYRTDSVARCSPRAPLSCVSGVRGLPEPPELHLRRGSGSRQPLAARSAAGPGGEGRLPERSVRDPRAQGPRTTRETR